MVLRRFVGEVRERILSSSFPGRFVTVLPTGRREAGPWTFSFGIAERYLCPVRVLNFVFSELMDSARGISLAFTVADVCRSASFCVLPLQTLRFDCVKRRPDCRTKGECLSGISKAWLRTSLFQSGKRLPYRAALGCLLQAQGARDRDDAG